MEDPKILLEDIVDNNLNALQMHVETFDIDVNIPLNLKIDDTKDFHIENPTMIQLCCYYKSSACFEYLIMKGADFSITDSYNRNCLHYIAFSGNYDFLQTFNLQIKGSINEYCYADCNGLTPVHFASISGNCGMIIYFYKGGIPIVNIPDNQGRSPIHLAIVYDRNEIFKCIFKYIKDNTDKVNINMPKLLQYAIKYDRVELLKELLSQNPKISVMELLQYASQNDSFFSARYLIQNHISQIENELNKAFIFACENGHTDIVRLLNKKGCDPNLHVEDMLSPLMASVKNGYSETCEFLIEHGANIEEISRTEFEIPSSDRPLKEIYDIFHEISNFNDETSKLLFMACEKGNEDILRLLLEHIDTKAFITIDNKLCIDKVKLIMATCKAIKKKGNRSKDSFIIGKPLNFKASSDLFEKKLVDDESKDDDFNEEEEYEEEEDEMDLSAINSRETKENLIIVRRNGINTDYPFYDPNYGRIYVMFNIAIEKALEGSIDPLDTLKVLKVLIDAHLLPHDITNQLIECLRQNLFVLIRFMLDQPLPFDSSNDDLRKLVENLSNEREIQDKFVKKGVKLTGEPSIFMSPFPEKSEFDI